VVNDAAADALLLLLLFAPSVISSMEGVGDAATGLVVQNGS
jgi:hypothetical protein